jgi:hypothetical protein
MRPLFFLLFFFTSIVGYGQLSDSIQHQLDSTNKIIQSLEDSIYRQRMLRNITERGQTVDRFLADFEERQKKERRQTYIKVGVGAVFLTALIYGILRKRRLQKGR